MAEMETGYSAGTGRSYYSGDGSRGGMGEEGQHRMSELGQNARHKVMSKLDEQKATLCSSLEQLASSLENTRAEGPQRQLVASAAGYLRRAENMLNQRSADELLSTALNEIRGRPGAMIAGAFVLGFLGARLLKT